MERKSSTIDDKTSYECGINKIASWNVNKTGKSLEDARQFE